MNQNEINTEERSLPISTQEAEEKRFQLNPNPKKHYQMTITIENAPGPFKNFESFAHYGVQNCSYILAGTPEASGKPDKSIPLQFKKIADNKYQGDFYVDAMKDEDYYGQGVCKWEFWGVNNLFSATGSETDTLFSASVDSEDLQVKKIERDHLKEDYPREKKIDRYLSQGNLNKNLFKPEEYFAFNIELEELK